MPPTFLSFPCYHSQRGELTAPLRPRFALQCGLCQAMVGGTEAGIVRSGEEARICERRTVGGEVYVSFYPGNHDVWQSGRAHVPIWRPRWWGRGSPCSIQVTVCLSASPSLRRQAATTAQQSANIYSLNTRPAFPLGKKYTHFKEIR